MRPEVIVHNTVSLDGAVSGFEVDMGLHYEVAGSFGASMHLIGSGTALAGLEMFGGTLPAETEAERKKPVTDPDDARAGWVVVDSRGRLEGKHHALRSSGYCRDVAVLVSAATPASYLEYLKERDYTFFQSGEKKVDLRRSLAWLGETFPVERVLVDAGPTLAGVLLEQSLVDRISLIMTPLLAGHEHPGLFDRLSRNARLSLICAETLAGGHLRLEYRVKR